MNSDLFSERPSQAPKVPKIADSNTSPRFDQKAVEKTISDSWKLYQKELQKLIRDK